MFTGIVKTLATIHKSSTLTSGIEVVLRVDTSVLDLEIGDSISISGVCSTVIDFDSDYFTVQYLQETLNKTTFSSLKEGDVVNIEPSLSPTAKLGGHFVQGHVDCTGKIVDLKMDDPWGVICVSYPHSFRFQIVPKGSICIDGISLTIVDVTDDYFSCHLIPHTFQKTSLKYRNIGHFVNLEFDILGKYIHKYMMDYSFSGND